jgi:hypothetical protein
MSFVGFCPKCGEPRPVGAAFCAKCGTAFTASDADNYQPQQGSTASNALLWLASLASIGGIVYFWINMDSDNLGLKLIAVGVVGAIWIGVVFAVVGLIGLLLGMGSILAGPFKRK